MSLVLGYVTWQGAEAVPLFLLQWYWEQGLSLAAWSGERENPELRSVPGIFWQDMYRMVSTFHDGCDLPMSSSHFEVIIHPVKSEAFH